MNPEYVNTTLSPNGRPYMPEEHSAQLHYMPEEHSAQLHYMPEEHSAQLHYMPEEHSAPTAHL